MERRFVLTLRNARNIPTRGLFMRLFKVRVDWFYCEQLQTMKYSAQQSVMPIQGIAAPALDRQKSASAWSIRGYGADHALRCIRSVHDSRSNHFLIRASARIAANSVQGSLRGGLVASAMITLEPTRGAVIGGSRLAEGFGLLVTEAAATRLAIEKMVLSYSVAYCNQVDVIQKWITTLWSAIWRAHDPIRRLGHAAS